MPSCRRMTSAAAKKRKTPPYSPSSCAGLRRKGNDGFMYISHLTPSGRYHWIRATKSRKRYAKKIGPAFAPQMAPNAPDFDSAAYKAAIKRCFESHSVKLDKRRSPSFSAQKCHGMVMRGKYIASDRVPNPIVLPPNYQSVPNRNGVYRWIKVTTPAKIRKIQGLQYPWYN